MRSCGIIAEYNPFHNGHAYQIQEARKKTSSDVMIVVMSGNFTQRGEPAIADKWLRAETALENGADLVVEQSVLGSVQSTDLFAKAGIRLLQELDCDYFSFGAEEGTTEEFIRVTDVLLEKEKQIDSIFQNFRNDGRNYASQMTDAIESVLGQRFLFPAFWGANSQLGISYMKENQLYPQPMKPIVIQRKGANHQEAINKEASFASGTAIRQLLTSKDSSEDISRWIPASSADKLLELEPVAWKAYWPFLRYRLLVESLENLRLIYQMEEGIEYRLKKFASIATSYQNFIELVKNKRWSWVRLQRLSIYVLLNIQRQDISIFFDNEPAVRVLGFTEKGREYLRMLKKEKERMFYTNISQKNRNELSIEIQSDQIYQFGLGLKQSEQNYTRAPIVKS